MTLLEYLYHRKGYLYSKKLKQPSVMKEIRQIKQFIVKLEQYRGVEYINTTKGGVLVNLIISPNTKKKIQ